MKKCIISAIAGALAMFMALVVTANIRVGQVQKGKEYEQIDYVSEIQQEDCAFCGSGHDALFSQEKGDNVGVLDLNTFENMDIPINNYDNSGQLLPEGAGYYKGYNQFGEDTHVHSMTFSNRGYADVEIHSAKYDIDVDYLQTHLCQDCLDVLNVYYWTEEYPPAYAIINFSEKTVRPLDQSLTWFLMENYGIDCEFKDNGNIYLRIIYCPPRNI